MATVTYKTTSDENKPCPFCGCEILEMERFENAAGHYRVYCPDCCTVGPIQFDDQSELSAIEAWNERSGE